MPASVVAHCIHSNIFVKDVWICSTYDATMRVRCATSIRFVRQFVVVVVVIFLCYSCLQLSVDEKNHASLSNNPIYSLINQVVSKISLKEFKRSLAASASVMNIFWCVWEKIREFSLEIRRAMYTCCDIFDINTIKTSIFAAKYKLVFWCRQHMVQVVIFY